MIECLLSLCLVSDFYIDGALGFQPNQHPKKYDHPIEYTNSYGFNIGELSAVMEFRNDMYIGLKHISGINTFEEDHGLNALMIGGKIRFK